MHTYVLRRLLYLIPILIFVSIADFSIIHLIPGDPAAIMLGQESASPEKLKQVRRLLGLDKPIYLQYILWVKGVLQGDFGTSLRTGEPVLKSIAKRLPHTLELALYSLSLALLVLPISIISVTFSNWFARICRVIVHFITTLGLSVPSFWMGAVLILLFSTYLRWFPVVNFPPFFDAPIKNLLSFFLPCLTLALPEAAAIARMTRSSISEVQREDYVTTARSKGLRESAVVFKHMLKNAMIPIITLIGVRIGYLLGGTIIIEQVFAIPGIGRLSVEAIFNRDYPKFQAVVLLLTVSFVLINLIVDLLYVFLSPKVRYSTGE